MSEPTSWLGRLAGSLDTQDASDTARHEGERSRTRQVVILAVGLIWTIDQFSGRSVTIEQWLLIVVALAYGALSSAYSRLFGVKRLHSALALAAVTLVLDPLALMLVLALDPERFAFLNAFVLFVIVRSGFRYGLRSLNVSWLTALLSTPLLLMNTFWRTQLELTFSFLLMLAVVPLFFAPLIRRVHNVRKLEEEKARMAAVHDVVLARSAFLAKVSHELRSPLQGIVSALDVLEMRRGQPLGEQDELVHRIRRSSLLLNTQLRDLLTLAKGEAGQLVMDPQPFEAIALVEAMGDAAAELAAAKGLAVRIKTPEEPLFVVADGPRIDQILTNLVVNSIRSTDSGEVCVTLLPYDASDRRLRFKVADTGPGLPAEVLPALLTPGGAVATGTDRRSSGEGSGLGLAIVRTLIDLLGGSIAVADDRSTGSQISIDIPAEPAAADGDTVPGLEDTGRVLIVDDRDDVGEALASVADELGYECERAASAAVAANLLAARRYDAVLVDVEMPGKGGAEIAADVRRGNGPNKATRFIGMSAGEVSDSLRSQFDGWLGKPIDRSSLRHALGAFDSGFRPSQPGLWSDDDDK